MPARSEFHQLAAPFRMLPLGREEPWPGRSLARSLSNFFEKRTRNLPRSLIEPGANSEMQTYFSKPKTHRKGE
jgi:hypothetical protein